MKRCSEFIFGSVLRYYFHWFSGTLCCTGDQTSQPVQGKHLNSSAVSLTLNLLYFYKQVREPELGKIYAWFPSQISA